VFTVAVIVGRSAFYRNHSEQAERAGDRVVTPPGSARLAGAINVPLQSVCPGARISHDQLPTSPVVTAIVLQAIGPGPVRRPSAADCG
jgi:hypothetical protein